MGTKTVTVDGKSFVVPDDATPEEIDAISGGSSTPREYSATEVPGEALRNLPSSAGNVVKGAVHSATHPVDTIKSLLSVAGLPVTLPAWGIGSMMPDTINPYTGEKENPGASFRKDYVQPALDYGQNLIDTYGGWDKIKRTLAEDPLRLPMDILGLTPAGQGLKGTRVAQGAANTAGKIASKTGHVLSEAPANMVDLLIQSHEGIGPGAIREITKAGEEGKTNVRKAISDGIDYGDVIGRLHNAVNTLVQNKSNAYNRAMSVFKGADSPVDFSKVDNAILNANEMGLYRGKSGNASPIDKRSPEMINAHNAINSIINKWKQADPTEFHTAYGFDQMKQELYDFVHNLPDDNAMKTPAQAYANKIMAAVRDTIRDVAPQEYVDAMDKYGKQQDQIRELRKEFKLGDNNTNIQTVRSLQKIYRRTADVAHGEKENLLRTAMQDANEPDLMQLLAAGQFNPRLPQGIRGAMIPALVASGTVNPLWLALSSPRLTGVTGYNVGRLKAAARRSGVPSPMPAAKAYGQMSVNPSLLATSRPQYSEPEEEKSRGGALSRRR